MSSKSKFQNGNYVKDVESTPLPILKIKPNQEEVKIKISAAKLIAEIRFLTLAHCEDAVIRMFRMTWQDGYSRGLSDMDKMHRKIDG